jgi:WD40 repeat protein
LPVAQPTSICFAPDGHRIAAAAWNDDEKAGRAIVVDVYQGAELFRSKPYRQSIIGLSFLPDGLVLVGALDWWASVLAWDVDAKREIMRMPDFDEAEPPARRGRAVAASADGLSFASCDGTHVDVWSVGDGERKARINVGAEPQTLALNPDGSVLFVGSPDAAAWSVGSGARLASLEGPGLVAVHPDGHRVVVVGDVVVSVGPNLETISERLYSSAAEFG